MDGQEAVGRAAKLGLSAWTVEAVAVGGKETRNVPVYCIGFESADFPLAEGESWEEAWEEAVRIVFAP